jgi:Flp pilus assembly protein TadG
MRRAFWRNEDGVSALEFGLVLPILMMILLGIIDYGHVFFVHLTMTNAAREGAREGVTRHAEDAQSAAVAAATNYLASAGIMTAAVVATTPTDSTPTVQVTVTVNPYTPLIGFVKTPDQLQVSAAMRWELANP